MSVQLGPEWERLQARLRASPAEYERQIRQTLNASLLLIEADARQLAARDTGRLGGSINTQIQGAYPALTGRVGPSAQYGQFVEFGRRPGARMPPVDALMGWVMRHWHTIAERRRGISQSRLRGEAFVLARAIARRGISARPFMRPAYEKNRERIVGGFARINVRMTAYFAGQPL